MMPISQAIVIISTDKLTPVRLSIDDAVADATPPRFRPPAAAPSLATALRGQNIYSLFEADSVAQAARSVAVRLLRGLGLGKAAAASAAVLVGLRVTVADDANDGPVILCGQQVAALTDDALAVLVSFHLDVSLDATHAYRLRQRGTSVAGATQYGFANVSVFGKNEDASILQTPYLDEARRKACDALATDFALPRLLYARLEYRAPLTLQLLLRDRAAPAAHLRTDWLSEMFNAQTYTVKCALIGPLSKQLVLARAVRLELPFAPADEPLDAILWQNSRLSGEPPSQWPYLVLDSHFLADPPLAPAPLAFVAPPSPPLPNAEAVPPPPQARSAETPVAVTTEPGSLDQPAVEEAEMRERRADEVVAHVVYDPLLYFAHHIPLAELTVYEIETYARARLHWHVLRLSEHEHLERTGELLADDAARHSRYPERSGAHRSLLRMLSRAALQREEHHEAVGLGVLALIAEPSAPLRASLLYLEALAIEATMSASDRESIDAAVSARLALLERFWTLCGSVTYSAGADASLIERVFASVARDWLSGLNEQQQAD